MPEDTTAGITFSGKIIMIYALGLLIYSFPEFGMILSVPLIAIVMVLLFRSLFYDKSLYKIINDTYAKTINKV
jgi:hypothetical protein